VAVSPQTVAHHRATASTKATATSAPLERKRKPGFIVAEPRESPRSVVPSSWARIGITRQLFGTNVTIVLFDMYVAAFRAASANLDELNVNECDVTEEVRKLLADAAEEAADDERAEVLDEASPQPLAPAAAEEAATRKREGSR
jgi:hypothetical protein